MLNAYVHTFRGACVIIHNDCDNNDDDDGGDYSKVTILQMITKIQREKIWNFKYTESECLEQNKCIA